MNKEFLIKVLLLLAIIFIIVLIVFVSVKLYQTIKNKNTSSTTSIIPSSANRFDSLIIADTSQSVQTKFFKDSAQHALDIIKGKEPVGLEDINFNGKEIMETLKFMNDDARSNIYIAIQYMMVSRPDGEEQMRQISYKEEIPMWMVIIRQAMLQTIPNLKFQSPSAPLSVSFSKTA